jgi:hypothetical protein
MAYRLKISVANIALDAIAALFPAGAILEVYKDTIPTDADTAVGAQVLLASITLPATPWAAASARSVAKQGVWQDASANAGAGDAPTWFRLKNAADTHRIDGVAGVGSGDASFDGTITAGQVVTITTMTITA